MGEICGDRGGEIEKRGWKSVNCNSAIIKAAVSLSRSLSPHHQLPLFLLISQINVWPAQCSQCVKRLIGWFKVQSCERSCLPCSPFPPERSLFFLHYKSSCAHMLMAEVFQRSFDKWPKRSGIFSSGDWLLMGTVINSCDWWVSQGHMHLPQWRGVLVGYILFLLHCNI